MSRFHVLIPAAGNGSRMQSGLPKQYLSINDKPMIAHSIQTFLTCPKIASVHVALRDEDTFWNALGLSSLDLGARLYVHRTGGENRAATIMQTLSAMQKQLAEQDWVLTHDAARPGLSLNLLEAMLDELAMDAVGGLLALPLADTLKLANHASRVEKTIPRDALWQAQTPQMFRYDLLKKALEKFVGTPTDEAQAIEALGLQPKLVTGSLLNMKVTYPQDVEIIEALLA